MATSPRLPLPSAATRRSGWRATALAVILCASSNVWSLGMDLPYTQFHTADDVTEVRTCGERGGAAPGYWRLVHAQRHAQSFLYVQWMQRDGNDVASAVHTLGIAELNNDHAEISLSGLTCRATPRGIAVTARAASGHDEGLRRVTIEIGPAHGVYRYREHRMR